MKYRRLERLAWSVSEIGFGTWTMGGMWGPRDDGAAVAALNRGVDLGINFIDTAAVYGDGHCETLVGNVLRKKNKRKEIRVATKVPPRNMQWPADHASLANEVFSASWIREQTEKSLSHLQSDYVDLQQLHVWSPQWLRQGEWLEELKKLKTEGKVLAIGVSINDHEPETAIELVQSGCVDFIQIIYNIFDQTPAEALFPLCEKNQVGVIARVPFDEGSLTGTLTPTTEFDRRDWRKHYFQGDRLKETCERVDKLRSYLNEETPTLSSLALKFCLAQPAVTTVIPGMKRISHVDENIQVSGTTPLSQEVALSLKSHAWPRNFYQHE